MTLTASACTSAAPESPALLDSQQVARLLNVSSRHVIRLVQRDELPRPMRLGRLVRWPRQALLDWIAAGCPSCATGRAAP